MRSIARLAMVRIRVNANLVCQKRFAGITEIGQRHAQERYGHLFPGSEEHVHFPAQRTLADRHAQVVEPIGFSAHRRDHDNDPVAGLQVSRHPLRDTLNMVDRGDAGAAEFLDDQCHARDPRRLTRLLDAKIRSLTSAAIGITNSGGKAIIENPRRCSRRPI